MTLSEYITSEFGIVPDNVQLEQIREIVVKEYARIEIKKGYLPEPVKHRERYHAANRWGNIIETVIVNTGGFVGFEPNVSDFPQTTSDTIIIGNKDF